MHALKNALRPNGSASEPPEKTSPSKRPFGLPVWASIVLIFTISIVATFALFAISPAKPAVLKSLIEWTGGLMPLLNWLPIFSTMLLLYFLFGSAMASISLVSFVVIVMAVVNRIKLDLRGDPLLHWDLSLIHEALGVVKAFGTQPIVLGILCVAVYSALSLLLIRLIPSRRIAPKKRVLSALACTLFMVVCNATLYSSKAIETALPTWGSFYNQADVHNSKGNLYEFIYTLNTSKTVAPDGYHAGETRAFAESYQAALSVPSTDTPLPHVIMIMGEAFSDISESEVLSFDNDRDPLAHFKALGEEGIAGHIVVPSRGGGTADTEHDVLTGRVSRYMRSLPYAYRAITSDQQETLPALFASLGYETMALHPGYGWFYNRQNVYPNLGFTQSVFEDSFPKEAYLDTFISEEATFDQFLSMIDGHLREDAHSPLFAFCLTIQNHAAYLDRYLPKDTVNFDASVPLTDEETNILSNYFAGSIDADTQLERLTDYLQTQDEPFVVVYFGDHLPSFSEALYDTLIEGADAPENSYIRETRLHKTPFIIWQNDATRAQDDLSRRAAEAEMPEDMTISSNYLGGYLLELLGLDAHSGFFHYLNQVRRQYPVLMETCQFDREHMRHESDDALLSRFQHWVYLLAKSG